MKIRSLFVCLVTLGLVISTSAFLSACSSSGGGYSRSSVHYGVGYGRYYGRPWGYDPVYVDGGIGGGPEAVQLPEMGMPDFGGGMDTMDMGGFDW